MIKFFLLDPTSIPPSPTPSGVDLHAPERIDLPPGAKYKTGSKLGIKIPKGYVGLLFARSKMASDTGIQAISQIIHHDFDGELQIVLQNKGKDLIEIKRNDKVAQLVVVPCCMDFSINYP